MLLLEDKYSKLVSYIDIPSEVGILEDDYDDGFFLGEDWEYDLNKITKMDISVDNGVSKAAIIIPGWSYVIKIPFNGKFIRNYDYDEECDEYDYDNYEETFEEFQNADDIDGCIDWDYCNNEYRKYLIAKEAGFGAFFAETKILSNENYPIYLQEKVKGFYAFSSDRVLTEEDRKQIRSHQTSSGNHTCGPIRWCLDIIEKYGMKRADELFDFLAAHNMNRDLHSGNVGYRENGDPVIIDWAGWRD